MDGLGSWGSERYLIGDGFGNLSLVTDHTQDALCGLFNPVCAQGHGMESTDGNEWRLKECVKVPNGLVKGVS